MTLLNYGNYTNYNNFRSTVDNIFWAVWKVYYVLLNWWENFGGCDTCERTKTDMNHELWNRFDSSLDMLCVLRIGLTVHFPYCLLMAVIFSWNNVWHIDRHVMLIFGVIESHPSKISEYGDYLFSNPITLDTTELHFIVGTLTGIIPLQQLQTA